MQTQSKISLLLMPEQLSQHEGILQASEQQKKPNGFEALRHDLSRETVNRLFPDLPAAAQLALTAFGPAETGKRHTAIVNKHRESRSGTPLATFYAKAQLRELQGLFEQLKPFAPLFKWQHRLSAGKNKVLTAPCSFSGYKPRLEFEVKAKNDELLLQTRVVLNGTAYPLDEFTRSAFLLRTGNEYFLLSYKDFQTLEWLQQHPPAQYSRDPEKLAAEILSRLDADYPVERNQLLGEAVVDGLPENRILLSEISGSFLVLTPQWVYDGFVVEGPWQQTQEITHNGKVYAIKRNRGAEAAFTAMLSNLHPHFGRQLNGYFYLSFAEAQKKQWFLKTYHRLLNENITLAGMDMLQHFRYSAHPAETTLQWIREEQQQMILAFTLRFGEESIPLQELQKTLLAGQKTILLKDGSMGVLDAAWMQQYALLLKHGRVTGRHELTVSRWMLLGGMESPQQDWMPQPIAREAWWEKWNRWQQDDGLLYGIPEKIQASLRPYQQKGFEWMALLAEAGAGCCLADDMGLGKTLQTICLLAWYQERHPASQQLIICPTSLLYNWQQELEKFAPQLRTHIHHGAERDAAALRHAPFPVILTTYNTLRNDIHLLKETAFGVVVMDESHNIKNPAAQITRAAGELNATLRIALSGTPVMNNTFDLYAQLNFILPGLFGSREFFKKEYADPIDRDQDPDKTAALRKITAPFILRRTKEQVAADLPDKVESVLWCEMGPGQQALYESIRDNIRSSVYTEIREKGLNKGKLSVLNGLQKLRQVCNSGKLVEAAAQHCTKSVKTEVLLSELRQIIPDHKALVFSQFTSMLDLLEKELRQQGIPFCRLDGQTPSSERQELVNRFQEAGSAEKVFLISLKAGNAGLNLTAADYVFLFDPWWNTAVQQQAIDRTHRIGQTRTVFAYQLICRGTVEEKIMQLQQRKKKLAGELIPEEEDLIRSLTEEDLEFLFS